MIWLRWQSLIDFAVLAAAFYLVLVWARGTRALRIVLGIIGLHATARLARYADLAITAWVLDALSILLLLLLVVAFQAEFRNALMRLDSLLRLGLYPRRALESGYRAIAEVAFSMAEDRLGALIVVVRRNSVHDLISDGVSLGAEISPQILQAIFRKDSPIHDGAVVVEADRISRAGAVLPLTQRPDVPFQFGTRHRAAMGLAERCDALVIVVSEERGEVTLMNGQQMLRVESAGRLLELLKGSLAPPKKNPVVRIVAFLGANLRLKLASAGLAALIWAVTTQLVGTSVRTVMAPIEFTKVPAGMAITSQSVTRVEVRLRGSPWIMEASDSMDLVARLNLSGTQPGWRSIPIDNQAFDLPPGVVMDHVSPQAVSVNVVQKQGSEKP